MSRYLKKIEKDEAYLDSVSGLRTILKPLYVFGLSSMRYVFFGVQVSRYLKKIEKDEAYLDSVSGLGTIIKSLRFLYCHL